MPLVREFAALTLRTVELWIRFLPRIGTWILGSWLLYITCLMTSALLGSDYGALGPLVFVVGVTFNVVGVILAIHELKPGLTSADAIRASGSPRHHLIPDAVFVTERRVDVAVLAIGPVLGVYAVWALIDDMIRDGFVWNTVIRSLFGAADWSINRHPDRLGMYVAFGVAALVGKWVWGWLVRRRRSSWWRVPLVFLEGLFAFAAFFIALLGLEAASVWLAQRRIWREGEHAWHALLGRLPELQLPFDVTLPEAVRAAGIWLSERFIPGFWEGIVLPLVWLAVVAMVFGWRQFRARDLLGDHVRARTELFEQAHGDLAATVGRLVHVLTADLRDKYIPLLHALRLVWRSGPYVLGAYLVLSALITGMTNALSHTILSTFGVDSEANLLRTFNAADAIQTLAFVSLSVCLYAAAFDRGLADAFRHAAPIPEAGGTDIDGEPAGTDGTAQNENSQYTPSDA